MKLYLDLLNPGKIIVEDVTIEDAIKYERPVQVYYNLHKHTFSIRDKQTRRVIGHSRSLHLADCKLKVSEAGRQRVLREKKKNVHATIEGTLLSVGQLDGVHPWDLHTKMKGYVELTYNPYRYDSFVRKDTKRPIIRAGEVLFNTKQIWGTFLTPRPE